MTKNIVFLFILGLFIGCGNSSNGNKQIQNTTSDKVASKSIDTTEKMVVAKDNLVRDVIKPFNGYKLRVLTDKVLKTPSKDIILLSVTVDGKDSRSFLKLNSNYPIGTKIIVEVLSVDGNKLLAKSKEKIIDSDIINFGSIDIK